MQRFANSASVTAGLHALLLPARGGRPTPARATMVVETSAARSTGDSVIFARHGGRRHGFRQVHAGLITVLPSVSRVVYASPIAASFGVCRASRKFAASVPIGGHLHIDPFLFSVCRHREIRIAHGAFLLFKCVAKIAG